MNSKKGQVTIFVIIGIILVIGIGFFIYTYNSQMDDSFSQETLSDIEKITTSLEPIRSYVQQCVHDIAYNGLLIMGQHGGMLNTSPERIYYDPIDVRMNDGVYFNDEFIPYWSISEDTNEVIFEQGVRFYELEDLEKDLENYINTNLAQCLGEMSSLEYQNNLDISDETKTIVKFGEDKVLIRVDKIIQIENSQEKVNDYYVEINLPFKKYYDIATAIAISHMYGVFSENLLLHLIGYYTGIDSNKLPPIYDTQMSYVPVIWTQMSVESKIKELLQSHIQILRINGTKNSGNLNLNNVDEMTANLLLKSQMNFLNSSIVKDAEISFIYNNFPIYTRVYGQKANDKIIMPGKESDEKMFGPPNVRQIYQFYYDVTAPIVIDMRFDPVIEGQEPFIFMFAIETNIRKNLRWMDSVGENGPMPWDDSWVSITGDIMDSTPIYNEETGEYERVPITRPEKIFFGDENQRISGNLNVKIFDEETLQELENVRVAIGIGDYAETTLGYTLNQTDEEIKFVGKAPIVDNGYLSFELNDYSTKKIKVSTKVNEEQNIFVKLPKIINKNVSVKIYDLELGQVRDLYEYENAMITIERINELNEFVENKQIIFADKNNINNITIPLISGNYIMSATLIDHQGIIIPAECKKIKVEDNLIADDEYIWIPEEEIVMKPAIWGGFEFNESRVVYISKSNVYSNSKIEFTLAKEATTNLCLDDLEKIGNNAQITTRYRSQLLPKFIS